MCSSQPNDARSVETRKSARISDGHVTSELSPLTRILGLDLSEAWNMH